MLFQPTSSSLLVALGFGLLAAAWPQVLPAANVSVLLEKARFLEETKGNVDEAMRIYRKIVSRTDANRPDVAEALLRLADCHARRGEAKEARSLFERITRDYADQESLADAARQRLGTVDVETSEHAVSLPVVKIGETVERILYENATDGPTHIDFDSGRLRTPTPLETGPNVTQARTKKWYEETGIDAKVSTMGEEPILEGLGLVGVHVRADYFSKLELKGALSLLKRQKDKGTLRTRAVANKLGSRPRTFLFRTREGGVGLVQFHKVEIVERPRFKLRYRLLERGRLPDGGDDELEAGSDAVVELSARGWHLWRQRKYAEAERLFERAITADAKNSNAFNGLGWSRFHQGKHAESKRAFEKCVELDPTAAAALNGLGWIANVRNKHDDAIAWWKKSVEASPQATAALSGLTRTLMERKDYAQASYYFEKWLVVDPKNKIAVKGLRKAKEASRDAGSPRALKGPF